MHSLGVNAYRFSISWERILPRIEPFVTIYHHEMPQILEDRYGGWLSHLIQEDFLHYAAVCFKEFGDRVKYWTTLNEANHIADFSYLIGQLPPMHCSPPFGNCSVGNSDVEPLIALHNMLMSHAKAANLYHKHFQAKQGGVVGIVVHAFMYEPFRDDEEVDREAVKRALAFNVAWMLDPLVYGEYPAEMRRYLGLDLPRFSDEEKELIRGSLDFIGLNHYSTLYAKDCIFSSCSAGGDRPIRGFLSTFTERDGIPIGEPTGMKTFFVVPRGMKKIVNYLKERYNNMPIFVTENGYSPKGEENEPVEDMLQDVNRIKFHKAYLAALASAIREGADVRGYFIWSLMDNFEWTHGYSVKFGLYYIDRISNSLQRTPKLSATWFTSFLTNTTLFNRTTQVSVPPHNPNVIHNSKSKDLNSANPFSLEPALVHIRLKVDILKMVRAVATGMFSLTSQEDIEIMQSLRVNAYRFSISWTRILPKGRFGNVNPKGIEFYNKIIDNLLLRGIEPFVTIFHADMPQIPENRYGGWLNHLIQ
ncbi:hypothetical protein FEM48_Zijuj12G0099200 [Ziziphus jujuba var. spinosa]|uniref:Beta-glucosidase 18-like n=1 Tax=Ziziphus jujuba var. spinosa TaxID=714518 RepID=A0A978UCM6_ZIZJJ|nr:hypothetical protein FEM48_Zijuj12G0099200 [Ziziphus jujuba var. spinosa]